ALRSASRLTEINLERTLDNRERAQAREPWAIFPDLRKRQAPHTSDAVVLSALLCRSGRF
ncbi:MAG: hypothetical protein ACYC3I_17770, partial [Gemmataceae bacterium]